MPIYGRPSEARGRKEAGIIPEEKSIFQEEGKRGLTEPRQWKDKESSLQWIEWSGIPISRLITERRDSGIARPVVVDWGCGKGPAIVSVAERFPDADCIGYSRESYPEWGVRTNARFVQAPTGSLHRYLKDGSVDIIYSYEGIMHMQMGEFPGGGKPERLKEVESLIWKLKHGGEMWIHNIGAVDRDWGSSRLLDELKKRKDIEVHTYHVENMFSGITRIIRI